MKTTVFVFLIVTSMVLATPDFNKWIEILAKLRETGLIWTTSTTTSPATEADIKDLISGNTHFAFDLFRAVSTPSKEENMIFSPFSISSALAMTFAGAAGRTASQMKSSLHLTCPNVHGAFKDVNAHLSAFNDAKDGSALKVANSLWGQSDYSFKQSFVELVKENYRSELKSVNFQSQGEEAKKSINEWVDEHTNGMIKEVLTQTPTSVTRLLLVNAIYFKAFWAQSFLPYLGEGDFKTLSGDKYPAVLMSLDNELNFFEDTEKGFLSFSLPYKNNKASMTIILPEDGKFTTIKNLMNAEVLSSILSNMTPTSISLSLPKFKFDSEFKLKEALQKLGLTDAFNAEANFSGIDGTRGLAISDAIHKATIAINQKGTEAAAVTIVPQTLSGGRRGKRYIWVNRPFMFVIHDEKGSVLFMGQVTNPERSV